MLLALLLVIVGQEAPAPTPAPTPIVAEAIAAYREQTLAEIPCRRTSDGDEIIVCALRDADRYRVSFVTFDPETDSDAARLRRVLYDPVAQGITPCGQGAFTVRCGSVGVSVTMGADGSVRSTLRELAP
jgi:hypothetical protein